MIVGTGDKPDSNGKAKKNLKGIEDVVVGHNRHLLSVTTLNCFEYMYMYIQPLV